jgi:hypothetical protein
MSQGKQDGFNSGFTNFFSGAQDFVGGLLDTAVQYEQYRNVKDYEGKGQADLANSVETNYNEQAANVGNTSAISSISNKTLMYAGAATVALVAVVLLIKR